MLDIGDEIPADALKKIDAKKVDGWRKSGDIGDMVTQAVVSKAATSKIKELEDSCRAAVKRVKDLEELLETERRTIAELGEGVSNRDAIIVEKDTALEGNKATILDFETREREALEAYNGLKAKVLGLESEAKAVLALKAELREVPDVDKAKD
jgi:hypothetical protein